MEVPGSECSKKQSNKETLHKAVLCSLCTLQGIQKLGFNLNPWLDSDSKSVLIWIAGRAEGADAGGVAGRAAT